MKPQDEIVIDEAGADPDIAVFEATLGLGSGSLTSQVTVAAQGPGHEAIGEDPGHLILCGLDHS